MKPLYTAQLQTSRETVLALSKAIYRRYGTKTKRVLFLCSFLLAVSGFLLGWQSRSGIVLLALACLLLSQFQYPAVYQARRVSEAFGSYWPRICYEFYPDHFCMSIGERKQDYAYSIICSLYRENGYLYLFPDEKTAFMLDPAKLVPAEPEQFCADLSGWAGVTWSVPRPFLFQSLFSNFLKMT